MSDGDESVSNTDPSKGKNTALIAPTTKEPHRSRRRDTLADENALATVLPEYDPDTSTPIDASADTTPSASSPFTSSK